MSRQSDRPVRGQAEHSFLDDFAGATVLFLFIAL